MDILATRGNITLLELFDKAPKRSVGFAYAAPASKDSTAASRDAEVDMR
jgi:hypothetical protein